MMHRGEGRCGLYLMGRSHWRPCFALSSSSFLSRLCLFFFFFFFSFLRFFSSPSGCSSGGLLSKGASPVCGALESESVSGCADALLDVFFFFLPSSAFFIRKPSSFCFITIPSWFLLIRDSSLLSILTSWWRRRRWWLLLLLLLMLMLMRRGRSWLFTPYGSSSVGLESLWTAVFTLASSPLLTALYLVISDTLEGYTPSMSYHLAFAI